MPIRSLLTRSLTARLLCVLVIVLFMGLCGLHLAGAHHDADGDGIALAQLIAILLLLLAAVPTVIRRRVPPPGLWIVSIRTRLSGPTDPSARIAFFLPALN